MRGPVVFAALVLAAVAGAAVYGRRAAAGAGRSTAVPTAAPTTATFPPIAPAPEGPRPCEGAGPTACAEADAAMERCRRRSAPTPPAPPIETDAGKEEREPLPSSGRSRLRVAVCYFGLTRAIHLTLCNQMQTLYRPLLGTGATVDVFAHTFSLNGTLDNPRSGEVNVGLPLQWHLLPFLRDVRVEPQEEFVRSLGSPDALAPAGLAQSYDRKDIVNIQCEARSLEVVTELWQKYGKYDVVVYLRPDIAFLDTVNVTAFAEYGRKVGGQRWWVSSMFDIHTGVNDRFALGSPQTMYAYGTRRKLFLNFTRQYTLHSERLLQWSMRAQNMPDPLVQYVRLIRVRVQSTENNTVTPDAWLVKSLWDLNKKELTDFSLTADWGEADGREKRPKKRFAPPGKILGRGKRGRRR